MEKLLNAVEHAILLTETDGAEPRLSVRSNTRVDAGRWWRRTPLWVCVTEHDVVVLAAARRQYIQRLPLGQCQASHYCHTTGELVIEGSEDLRFSRLAMSPVDGLLVLDAIHLNKTQS